VQTASPFRAADGSVVPLATDANLLRLSASQGTEEHRNHVIVVGARKATVVESDNASVEERKNEFHVAVGVDPLSIYDPTNPHFVGGKRMAVVFDEKVADGDFARWLARTILHRYRAPLPTPTAVEHTILPALELRDALSVIDVATRQIRHQVYVTGFTESWTVETATTQIDAVPYPELGAYQPREDLDIDTLFRRDPADPKSGVPAINVRLSYLNLFGERVTNTDLANPAAVRSFRTKPEGSAAPMKTMLASALLAFGPGNLTATLPDAVIPETMYLARRVPLVGQFFVFNEQVLTNNPYRQIWRIANYQAGGRPTVQFLFEEGDGSPGIYDAAGYEFPAPGLWNLCYDHLQPRAAKNPFYDPYSSDERIGNLVSVKFDQLVSGRVRVSLWDANPKRTHETPVAWLTNPTGTPEDPEAHWVYAESGMDREFLWGGADNIGFWNQLQSQPLAEELRGAFGDEALKVGRGFYVWDDQTTALHTLIGDMHPNNFDTDHTPYYTIGRFGQFYVRIEIDNDVLRRRDRTGRPRAVETTDLPRGPNNTWNATPEAYVFTHLGEPTQLGIRVQEWVANRAWAPGGVTTASDWSAGYSVPDADATIQDGRPVRFTFVPEPRRGHLFRANGALDPTLTAFKLTRQVH